MISQRTILVDSEREPGLDNTKAFGAVCEMLQAGHQFQKDHSPSDTLNRLFVKNLGGADKAPDAPKLTAGNVTVRLEKRPKPELRKLAPRKNSRTPNRLDLPVVIVRYRGEDRLIDGGSRCHHWHTNGEIDEHDVWVLTVNETSST
jgi:hypothetical protein